MSSTLRSCGQAMPFISRSIEWPHGVKIADSLDAEVIVLSHSLKKQEDGRRDPETFKKLIGYFDLIINTAHHHQMIRFKKKSETGPNDKVLWRLLDGDMSERRHKTTAAASQTVVMSSNNTHLTVKIRSIDTVVVLPEKNGDIDLCLFLSTAVR